MYHFYYTVSNFSNTRVIMRAQRYTFFTLNLKIPFKCRQIELRANEILN